MFHQWNMADLNEMLIFVRVVQAGSLTAAAQQMRMPKSTVSRKLSELEGRVGARLLQRTPRKLGLTEAGRMYYEHAARIAGQIEEAEQAVGRLQGAPRGILRVTVPLSFGMLGAIVAEYLERHADVRVEMVSTDRPLDIVEERFDAAIRAGPLADSTFVARNLGLARRVLVASPRYCKQHGAPRSPAELRQHTCVAFGAGTAPNTWILEATGKRVEVRVTPRLAVNDLEIAREAVAAGAGIGWFPELVCLDDLREGRLRHVLTDWCSAKVPLHALYPTARHLSPKVTAFIELVAKRLRPRFKE